MRATPLSSRQQFHRVASRRRLYWQLVDDKLLVSSSCVVSGDTLNRSTQVTVLMSSAAGGFVGIAGARRRKPAAGRCCRWIFFFAPAAPKSPDVSRIVPFSFTVGRARAYRRRRISRASSSPSKMPSSAARRKLPADTTIAKQFRRQQYSLRRGNTISIEENEKFDVTAFNG